MWRSRRAHNDFSVEESRTLLWNFFFFSPPRSSFSHPHPHSAVRSISDTTAISTEWFCLALVLNKWVDCIQCVLYFGLISVVLAQKHPTLWFLIRHCNSQVCSRLCLLVTATGEEHWICILTQEPGHFKGVTGRPPLLLWRVCLILSVT